MGRVKKTFDERDSAIQRLTMMVKAIRSVTVASKVLVVESMRLMLQGIVYPAHLRILSKMALK